MFRYSTATRERMVREYRRSGLTQAKFAKRHGLKLNTLRTWIYDKRRQNTAAGDVDQGSSPVRLLPVTVRQTELEPSQSPTAGGAIEAALPAGVWLRFPVGTDCSYVAQLLSAIAER